MKNQMNCIQSDPYQRTLHIKVKQTQRLLLGVGILLLSTIASQAQSLLPSARQTGSFQEPEIYPTRRQPLSSCPQTVW